MTEPGDREPAPGDLGLLQAFVNTASLEEGLDELDGVEGFSEWLFEEGLVPERMVVSEEELGVAVELREALRALLRANNGEKLDPASPETLRRVGGESPLVVSFSEDGSPRLEPVDGGVRGALARILAAVERAEAEGSFRRLKACREDVCQWAFYDRSRNRSGRWCSMSVCGTRSKMRAYRGSGAYRRRGEEG